MLKIVDAFILSQDELRRLTASAVAEDGIAPTDSYVDENDGPFVAVPVCNILNDLVLFTVVHMGPDRVPPKLPDDLTVDQFFAIVDGSVRAQAAQMRQSRNGVCLEIAKAEFSSLTPMKDRMDPATVSKYKYFGLEFLARQMERCGYDDVAVTIRKARDEHAT